MHQRPRLIAELVTLTRPWGWTLPDLARELTVSLASLNQYRSGRRPLTMPVYSRIVERFGEHRLIRDAAYEYARTYHAPTTPTTIVPADELPVAAARALRRFVERFPEEALRGGGGLFLASSAPKLLAASVAYLRALFAATHVQVAVVRADQPLRGSEARDALAAPLLIIERVEFLQNAVAELLRRREEIVRPTIVTSASTDLTGLEEDIRRILRSRMRPLVVTAPPVPGGPVRPITAPPTVAHAAA